MRSDHTQNVSSPFDVNKVVTTQKFTIDIFNFYTFHVTCTYAVHAMIIPFCVNEVRDYSKVHYRPCRSSNNNSSLPALIQVTDLTARSLDFSRKRRLVGEG